MIARACAALVLGFLLSVAICGLVALLWPGALTQHTLVILLLFFPLWMSMTSASFLFKSGRAAWLWLSLATCIGFGLLHLLKGLAVVEVTL